MSVQPAWRILLAQALLTGALSVYMTFKCPTKFGPSLMCLADDSEEPTKHRV